MNRLEEKIISKKPYLRKYPADDFLSSGSDIEPVTVQKKKVGYHRRVYLNTHISYMFIFLR